MSSRSDPAVIQRCVDFVRSSSLPILNESQDKLVSAVHGSSDAWRKSASSVFTGLIQEDVFLALRVARDSTRAAAECHTDVPNTLEGMISLSGLGRYHEYVSCPKLEFDWPPNVVGTPQDTAAIRERMVRYGSAAIAHARLAVKEGANFASDRADEICTLTLLVAAADFALALAMPKRIHDALSRAPARSFEDTLMQVGAIHPDDFYVALSLEMGWPMQIPNDVGGTLTTLCHSHGIAWRNSFAPSESVMNAGTNVVRLR